MRTLLPAVCLLLTVASAADAQVYRNETPPPTVTAANTRWLPAGEPIFFAGSLYYPAGARVFFDGKVMVRTGSFDGVPLYADVTLEPYSIVLVPIGGRMMQPFERRREGEMTGTVGSRTPSFPIGRDVELSAMLREPGLLTPPVGGFYPEIAMPGMFESRSAAPIVAPRERVREVRETAADAPFEAVGVLMLTPQARREGGNVRFLGNGALIGGQVADEGGLWIDYDGAQWKSVGRAVDFDASRFEHAGTYHGFPVYRERGVAGNRIFVTVLRNGPLAPFERR